MKITSLETQALKFIKTVSDNMNDLYAGNSGGKDSAVLDYILQKSGIKYISIYANTTIDPPKTIKYIRQNYPHTVILQPKETFYQLIERKSLPTRINRYCCEYLKEYASIGRNIFEGVRSCESQKRKGRDYINCDLRKSQKGSQHIYPLYDWKDEDIYEFIYKYSIPLAPHYSTGATRLGCVGCPQVTKKGIRKNEFELYPKFYTAIKNAIERGMKNNPQWRLTIFTDCNAEEAMQWWLSGEGMKSYFEKKKQLNINF